MKQVKKIITRLWALIALATIAACHPADELNNDNDPGTRMIEKIEVKVERMMNTRADAGATRAEAQGMEGVVKTAFVEGDVVHINVATKTNANGDAIPEIYTATYIGSDAWKLDRPMLLPQVATETLAMIAFYNGEKEKYDDFSAFDAARNTAMYPTPESSGLTTYIDLLFAYGGSNSGGGWDNEGITLTPDGTLAFVMSHRHALLGITSISNQLGSPITSLHANLVRYSGSTTTLVATVDLPLSGGTAGTTSATVAEALAASNTYLQSFTVALANQTKLTIAVPDKASSEGVTATPGLGTYLNLGKRYTYRLILKPNSLTAIPTNGSTGDAPGWEEGGDPAVPEGYTPIYDRAGLEAMGKSENLNNPKAKFILMADIDLTPGQPDGSGGTTGNWTPIGTYNDNSDANAFTGIFHGNGHIIKGMTIDNSGSNNRGLFEAIDGNAILYNIHLRDVNVTGNYSVGALVGRAGRGTISGCSSTGTVSGGQSVGGLVGYNNGAHITRCWSTAAVSGTSTYVGGLVGINEYATIVASYTQGSVVSSSGNTFGGLVGINGTNSSIFGCYAAEATVTGSGTGNIGALVGWNYNSAAAVTSCYATNAASSNTNKLVGANSNGATISACISPLAGASGELSGTGIGITTSTNYAPLTTGSLSIANVRTVVIDPATGAIALDANGKPAPRTWTAAGIWGTIADGSKIPPIIQWSYNGEAVP